MSVNNGHKRPETFMYTRLRGYIVITVYLDKIKKTPNRHGLLTVYILGLDSEKSDRSKLDPSGMIVHLDPTVI